MIPQESEAYSAQRCHTLGSARRAISWPGDSSSHRDGKRCDRFSYWERAQRSRKRSGLIGLLAARRFACATSSVRADRSRAAGAGSASPDCTHRRGSFSIIETGSSPGYNRPIVSEAWAGAHPQFEKEPTNEDRTKPQTMAAEDIM